MQTRDAVILDLIAASEERSRLLSEQVSSEEQYRHRLESELSGDAQKVEQTVVRRRRSGLASGIALPEKIAVILKGGDPMRAADIAAKLEAGGMKSTAKRGLLPTVISALRRRDDLFQPVQRGVYKLKSKT